METAAGIEPGAALARDETRRRWLALAGLPPLALVALAALLQWSGADAALAGALYDPVAARWALDTRLPPSQLLYQGERWLIAAAVLTSLGVLASGLGRDDERSLRRPLIYVLACLATTVGLVSLGKHVSNVDCPRALAGYGGSRPYVALFANRPDHLPRAMCFPAGHSSSAFSFVSLYFLPIALRRRSRRIGLVVGLGLGLAFGATQWARGMHFLSHDAVSLAIAWAVAAALSVPFGRREHP